MEKYRNLLLPSLTIFNLHLIKIINKEDNEMKNQPTKKRKKKKMEVVSGNMRRGREKDQQLKSNLDHVKSSSEMKESPSIEEDSNKSEDPSTNDNNLPFQPSDEKTNNNSPTTKEKRKKKKRKNQPSSSNKPPPKWKNNADHWMRNFDRDFDSAMKDMESLMY